MNLQTISPSRIDYSGLDLIEKPLIRSIMQNKGIAFWRDIWTLVNYWGKSKELAKKKTIPNYEFIMASSWEDIVQGKQVCPWDFSTFKSIFGDKKNLLFLKGITQLIEGTRWTDRDVECPEDNYDFFLMQVNLVPKQKGIYFIELYDNSTPHGFTTPLYVGSSINIHNRLTGSHHAKEMTKAFIGSLNEHQCIHIQYIIENDFFSFTDMENTEKRLISLLRPEFNKSCNPIKDFH